MKYLGFVRGYFWISGVLKEVLVLVCRWGLRRLLGLLGKYHEMDWSFRGFSRISHRVCLQVEDSAAVQVYKPRKV